MWKEDVADKLICLEELNKHLRKTGLQAEIRIPDLRNTNQEC
jgi:hypothetical protein